MQTLGKFIAGICAILFIITGVMALLFFNIERKAFNSTTYKQAFENQNLYARMPSILANTLSATILQNQNTPTFIKTLTLTDWESAISSMLPPEELKAITDDALDSVFDYINRRTDSVTISVIPLKSHLIGPSGVEVVKQVLRVQPACTTEQLQAIAFGFLSGGDIILCSPPEDVLTLLTPIIESQIQVMTVAIPDEVTLISSVLSGTPSDPRCETQQCAFAHADLPSATCCIFTWHYHICGTQFEGLAHVVGLAHFYHWRKRSNCRSTRFTNDRIHRQSLHADPGSWSHSAFPAGDRCRKQPAR